MRARARLQVRMVRAAGEGAGEGEGERESLGRVEGEAGSAGSECWVRITRGALRVRRMRWDAMC